MIEVKIILPPIKVQVGISSLKKIQTQRGLKAISKKRNSVASAANKCFVAKTKHVFTKPEKMPPNKIQRKRS